MKRTAHVRVPFPSFHCEDSSSSPPLLLLLLKSAFLRHRARPLTLALSWLLALLLSSASAVAAADFELDASCPWIDREGYTPVLLTARGLRPGVVEVEATLDGNRARTRLEVAAGGSASTTLLLPGSARRWSTGVEVSWRAPGQAQSGAYVSPKAFRELDVVVIDPEESLPLKELREVVVKRVGNPPSSRYSSSGSYADERFNRWAAEAVPSRWQGWPAWITVITTPSGDRRLSETQRAALAAWTLAGGQLLVADPSQIAGWNALGAQVSVLDRGRLIERIQEVWRGHERWPVLSAVPGTGTVPVGGFVTIAVLFAVLVGPANLWWCARRGRRSLLLVTTPVLSLIASALLLGYGLIADGLALRRVAEQVMVLDPQHDRAAVWTRVSVFAGLAPGAIELDPGDLLQIQVREADDRRELADARLDWFDGGQAATGSWIPARSNRQLSLTTVRPERRRLQLVGKDGGIHLTNGFDRPLTAFSWSDDSGQPWQVTETVAPGATVALVRGSQPLALPLDHLPSAAALALPSAHWTARFEGALLPLPGPAAEDIRPTVSWVVGPVRGIAARAGSAPGAPEQVGF